LEKSTRTKVLVGVMSAIVLTIFASSALARNIPSITAGTYQTGIFSKSYGWGEWIYLNNASWTTLMSLSLPDVPINAYYHVVCDGYAGIQNAVITSAIGVDGPTEDTGTRRFYGSEVTSGFMGTGIHTERTYYLGAGSHTFYFLGTIYNLGRGGYSDINYHTITVTIFTDGSATALTTTPQTSVSANGK
jgi:hypothetical protein